MLIKAKFNRPKPEPVPCQGCRIVLVQSGRRCAACRTRKCRGALIDGEACGVCGIDLPRVLRWHRFTDATVALCANHEALAGRRPTSWALFRDQASAAELLSA
jgi:hypothetical protein